VSALAFTTTFFTLDWAHTTNTVEYTRDTLVYSTVDSDITIP